MSEDSIAGRDARPSAFTLRSAPESDADTIVDNARATVRRRILRRQLIGSPDLFGEPAWDMLLDLFINECEGKPVAMSSLCIAADIPTSSAMKLVQKLCDAGLLERIPDHSDGRRSLMRICPEVAHRMRAYFAEGTE
jgi:DNA repair protein RadC